MSINILKDEKSLKISNPTDQERIELTSSIIEVFEDFLEEKGIKIENPEKEASEGPAILYGSDYYGMVDQIEEILFD